VDVKADDEVLDDKGLPDIALVKPIIYAPESQAYHAIGNYLGRAFTVGKGLQK
jgi:hypothetical protein